MKKELIRQVSEDYISQYMEHRVTESVKEKKEIKLNGLYVTMWDGAGERMDRLTCHDGEVFIVDVFGGEYNFEHGIGLEALAELYYFMFVDNQSSEE